MAEVQFIDLGNQVQGGATPAHKVPEINYSAHYYWMKNPKGRRVPISQHNVQWALKNHFLHTNGELHYDDLKDQIQAIPVSPTEQLAKAAQQMANLAKVMTQPEGPGVENGEKPRRGRQKKSVETSSEVAQD